MAMLAEPRRRQRVGPNPRGKFFIEDSNNKGRHLLMKMGWKHGDGLGVERQGMTEPIIPKIHTDNRGLGFDVKSDPWVAHTDDFEAILQNLKTANGIVDKEDDDEAEMEVEDEELDRPAFGFGFGSQKKEKKSDLNEKNKSRLANISLEAHSKSSKNRIHYQKFVKNKDLSKIKAHDWNCIFGKSVIAELVQEPAALCSTKDVEGSKRKRKNDEEVPEVENGNVHDVEPDEKTKKKKKKKRRQEEDAIEESSKIPLHDVDTDTNEIKKERKKKKKKNKQETNDNDEEVASSLVVDCQKDDSVENNGGESEDIPKKKKKIKKGTSEKDEDVVLPFVVDCHEEDSIENKGGENEDAPKKKKKRKKDKEIEVNELIESKEINEDETPYGITQKKSKKNKKDKSKEEIPADDINVAEPIMEEIEVHIELPVSVVVEACAVTDTAAESPTDILIPVETLSTEATSETTSVTRKPKVKPDAEEIHTAAVQFKGSNILQIPGYRNQSNKPVPL